MENLTPAMRQYFDLKRENADAILFFRMGDFYEMFYEDALVASKVLGIALTSRDKLREVPMCGVPHHSANSYIAKLVREGYKVAVCEQVEDPAKANGLVERAVVRVVTPGIALEDELLDPKANNYIASIAVTKEKGEEGGGGGGGGGRYGFSYMDVSTGEFFATSFKDEDTLKEELIKIRPLELLIPEDSSVVDTTGTPVKKVTRLPARDFDHSASLEKLKRHFGTSSLDGFGLSGMNGAVSSAGALLNYIKETQKSDASHVKKCSTYSTDDSVLMDSSTRRNLEITQNMRGEREGTLLALLDRTRTSMGARRLKTWLLSPLKDVTIIRARLDAVEDLFEDSTARKTLSELLNGVYDLERLTARVSMRQANPRDLSALRRSLERIPAIKEALRGIANASPLIASIEAALDPVEEASSLIGKAISDSPPLSVKDGGVIRPLYSAELDELRSVGSGGKVWIASLEASERKSTGITSLKVGYNRVFGYYIEVTKPNLPSVPPDYIRKQTLVNAERFITPELKSWEDKILNAEEKALKLEAELYSEILDKTALYSSRMLSSAEAVSTLDSLSSLAEAASSMDYVKPEINEGGVIVIEGGRHPVVEASVTEGSFFVSNDLVLDNETSMVILTGPNMAGKSTYLRQNALIVLMAQAGSFVPASRASIGAVDRIFTRVGASDDLSRGQSTFMVEMNETANILNNATSRSLVILDEIGRGTSTFDGLSIAWAVAEHLHDNASSRPKTLFATHYHELTELSLTKERVKNYNMAVKEWEDKVIFLRKVVPGGANRSYGIQVARLAGLPSKVIDRAREILKNLERGELNESGLPRIASREGGGRGCGGAGTVEGIRGVGVSGKKGGGLEAQMNLLGAGEAAGLNGDSAIPSRETSQAGKAGPGEKIREELERIDVNSTTPVEALNIISRLKEMLKN